MHGGMLLNSESTQISLIIDFSFRDSVLRYWCIHVTINEMFDCIITEMIMLTGIINL